MSTYSIPDDSCAGRILLAFSSVMIEARVQLEAGWRQAGWIVDWCEGQHALARLLAMHQSTIQPACRQPASSWTRASIITLLNANNMRPAQESSGME